MRSKLGAALLAMLLAGAFLPAAHAATPATPDLGMKGAAATDRDVPAVPASTQWGMLVMVLLVLTASTYVFLNDSRFERGPVGPVTTPPRSSDPPDPEDLEPPAERGTHSPKNKSKRAFSRRRQSHDQSRKGWNIARRGTPQAGGRRRSGPGCRGVR